MQKKLILMTIYVSTCSFFISTSVKAQYLMDMIDTTKGMVKGSEIKKDTQLTAADLKYNTLGLGYIFYMNDNLKWVLWYEIVKNEKTQLVGLTEDLKDNVFTFRMQYRF